MSDEVNAIDFGDEVVEVDGVILNVSTGEVLEGKVDDAVFAMRLLDAAQQEKRWKAIKGTWSRFWTARQQKNRELYEGGIIVNVRPLTTTSWKSDELARIAKRLTKVELVALVAAAKFSSVNAKALAPELWEKVAPARHSEPNGAYAFAEMVAAPAPELRVVPPAEAEALRAAS